MKLNEAQQQPPAADLALTGMQPDTLATAGSGTQQPLASCPPNTGMLSSV
jgi:hypothetical protein